ncbi:MAG: hypothetical protein RSD49_08090 [Hafnia sp.]
MSNSRFQVGTRKPFISVRFQFENGRENHRLMPDVYQPWEHTLVRIDLFELDVKSEHESPVERTNGESTTGYVLQDDQGKEWYNQYPTASRYEEEDSLNWGVRRHCATSAELDAELAAPDHAMSGVSLEHYLLSIAAAIGDLDRRGYRKQCDQLKTHLDEVVQQFREQFQQEILFVPFRIEPLKR